MDKLTADGAGFSGLRRCRHAVVMFLATGCGLGTIAPFAPGTFGSLPGVLLAFGMSFLPVPVQIAAALALVALAIPICDAAEKSFGIVDDGRITADEWMLYPIAVLGLPFDCVAAHVVFFAVTRAIDIVKPPPARRLQRLPGGCGIVIDDFFANLYSLAANWAIYSFIVKWIN